MAPRSPPTALSQALIAFTTSSTTSSSTGSNTCPTRPPLCRRIRWSCTGAATPMEASCEEELQMPELMIDFITSLDGYGAAEGWPGWWGLEGPEYLAWLGTSRKRATPSSWAPTPTG